MGCSAIHMAHLCEVDPPQIIQIAICRCTKKFLHPRTVTLSDWPGGLKMLHKHHHTPLPPFKVPLLTSPIAHIRKRSATYKRRGFFNHFLRQIWALRALSLSRKQVPGFHKCTSMHLWPLTATSGTFSHFESDRRFS